MVVFLLGLLATGLGVYFVDRYRAEDDLRRFNRLVERVETTLHERIQDHVHILEGIRGYFQGSQQVTRQEFRNYIATIAHQDFPGGLGFGFIRYVSSGQLGQFLKATRQDGAPDFQAKRLSKGPAHFLVEFVEPQLENAAAMGLDISSENVRFRGAQAAVERNAATLTGRIELVQDDNKLPGFLLLLPVFSGSVSDPILDRRWAGLQGWVYSPIRVDRLLSGIVEHTDRMVDLELFENGLISRKTLLFDADEHLGAVTTELSLNDYGKRRFVRQLPLKMAGQEWLLVVSGNSEFEYSIRNQTSLVILVAGFLTSLLVAALLATSARTAREARALAEEMTLELRLSESQAREMFYEIEQQKIAMDEHAIVAVTDPKGTIAYVNEKFCDISGYSAGELLGKNHRMFNSGVHPASFFSEMYQTITRGKVWHGDICNRAKDGSLYWVQTTIVPFLNSSGKPVKYVAIRTDMTAIKNAEALLAQQRDELQAMVDAQTADLIRAKDAAEAASRAKSEFIANMSHEMRTPMHGIMALAEMGLKRQGELTPEKQLQYFSKIAESSRRMNRLVEDVLALSAISAEQLDPQRFIDLDLGLLTLRCVEGCRGAAADKQQQLVVLPDEVPKLVRGDASRLTQLLTQLLRNAIKFSPPSTTITVAFCASSLGGGADAVAAVDLLVSDEGVGIPEGELEHVFDSFTQSTRTSTGAGGTGLGLAICRQIARVHHGDIQARNRPEGGAILILSLPLSASHQSQGGERPI